MARLAHASRHYRPRAPPVPERVARGGRAPAGAGGGRPRRAHAPRARGARPHPRRSPPAGGARGRRPRGRSRTTAGRSWSCASTGCGRARPRRCSPRPGSRRATWRAGCPAGRGRACTSPRRSAAPRRGSSRTCTSPPAGRARWTWPAAAAGTRFSWPAPASRCARWTATPGRSRG